ncbi:MAG TPA: SDR family NAD(P)-dependent oxidoreductase [Terriglobales bacterium]|jgi:acyl-CoA synthetase (AMP-forming)/AMP-acid ligase II/NADP-dependent 3-hydroxy acid dehydrogenase YdfG|nr:SDR family NAD(P)-dependent oxidoreductase [Terriglobales bacterium]
MDTNTQATRDRGTAIAAALRQINPIADVHVVKDPKQESRYTAFIAVSRLISGKEILKKIDQVLAELEVKLELCLVTNIPYTREGAVDQEQLDRARPASQFALPEETGAATAPGRADGQDLGVSASERASNGMEKRPGPPALPSFLDGGPRLDSQPSAWRLNEILHRAATEASGRGIRFIGADGLEERLTYSQLYELAQKVAAGLSRIQHASGGFAIIAIESKKEFLLAFWGCVLAGLVPLPCAVPSMAESNDWMRLKAGWQLLERPPIITAQEHVPVLGPLIHDLQPSGRLLEVESLAQTSREYLRPIPHTVDNVALLLMTSGSSGPPKLVMQTHRALRAYCSESSHHNGFTEQDVSLNWFPFDHVGGLVMFHLRDTWLACEQIQAPTAAVLARPLRWLDWIDRYRVSITWAPNFAFALVNQFEKEINTGTWDLSCMRFVLNGGEAIVPAQARRFLALLQPHKLPGTAMHPAWGMSETCSGVVYSDHFSMQARPEHGPYVAVGKPIPGFSFRVVGPAGQVLPQGEAGELEVRGDSVTIGYYRNKAANEESFSPGGWFRTGDLATVREDQLFIVGRSKDILIINGRNYACGEIEAVVEQVPGVLPTFAAAVGLRVSEGATERLGVAFSATSDDPQQRDETLEKVRRALVEKFQCAAPVIVCVETSDIPKSSAGKIRRAEVREKIEQLWRASKTQSAAHPQAGVQETAGVEQATVPSMDIVEKALPFPEVARQIWRPRRAAVAEGDASRDFLVVASDPRVTRDAAAVAAGNGSVVCIYADPADKPLERAFHLVDLRSEENWTPVLRKFILNSPAPKSILFVLDSFPEATGQSLLSPGIQGGLRSLNAMICSLSKSRLDQRVRLYVIGGPGLAGREGASASNAGALASLGAWLKSTAAELPWLVSTLVSLPGPLSKKDAQACLAEELRALDIQPEVAYARTERLVPALAAAVLDTPRSRIEKEGLYLVTGGLGGVGQYLSEHLLKKYAARLLLVGRTPAAQLRPQSASVLRKLQAHQAVLYRAIDKLDIGNLGEARKAAEEHFKRPLRGVFHLAGVLGEGPLLKQSFSQIEEVLSPKVAGTNAVVELMADREAGLIVMFSSLNGLFGGAGVSAHAAASAYQLRFARDAGSSVPHDVYGIAWSVWKDTGQSQNRNDAELSAARGYINQSPAHALELFDFIVGQQPGHWVAGIDPRHPNIAWQYLQPPRYYEKRASETVLVARSSSPRNGAPVADIQASCLAGEDPEHLPLRDEVATRLREIWCEVLKLDDVGDEENFFDLGGHSLIVPRMLEETNNKLEAGIQTVDLFRYPTIQTLTERTMALLSQSGSRRHAVESL